MAASCRQLPPHEPAGVVVVDSTADIVAEDGGCTLREAIVAANTDRVSPDCGGGAGTDTVQFRLDGEPDFAIDGRAGYTIRPTSPLPEIVSPVTIDGYSQAGAAPNQSPSPRPLDGTLLVQLDGRDAGDDAMGLVLRAGSDRSVLRGLVIGGFGAPGSGGGVLIDASEVALLGNYIGTDPTGTIANGNGFAGFGSSHGSGAHAERIGGTSPADRNLISGNGSSAGYPHDGAVIQGNYVGADASGTRALPNATVNAAGALSIDAATDVLVGGIEPGAANLVSGNASHGLAPDITPGLVIAGNLIGTDWTGTLAVPNEAGITIAGDQEGSVIGGDSPDAANVVSGNLLAGIADGSTGGLHITGNTVGLDATGTTPLPNGIGLALRSDAVVGGPGGERNVVSGNRSVNVLVKGVDAVASGTRISGNLVGTDADGEVRDAITASQGAGVWIAGRVDGVTVGGDLGNRIAGNRGFGVGISSFQDLSGGPSAPRRVLVVGNEVFATNPGPPWPGAPGLAIDLFAAADTTDPFHPLDASPEQLSWLGTGAGPAGDALVPNDGVGAPTVVRAERSVGSLTIEVDPGPGADGPHRVDVYLNAATEPGAARHHVGQVLLSGAGRHIVVLDIPTGIDVTASWVTATVTRPDGHGGGSTGELSSPTAVVVG